MRIFSLKFRVPNSTPSYNRPPKRHKPDVRVPRRPGLKKTSSRQTNPALMCSQGFPEFPETPCFLALQSAAPCGRPAPGWTRIQKPHGFQTEPRMSKSAPSPCRGPATRRPGSQSSWNCCPCPTIVPPHKARPGGQPSALWPDEACDGTSGFRPTDQFASVARKMISDTVSSSA
jgi:hypothetical protein